jgi:AcrR family transcriptional regulator
MLAVATEGYRELTEAMRKASRDRDLPLERLKRAGIAYIEFALRRPEHFTVMFDAPVAGPAHQESNDAAKESFLLLVRLVKDAQDAGELSVGDPVEFAYLAWTMVHGVAKLAVTGRLPFRGKPAILRFASFVIDQSLHVEPRTRHPAAAC